MYGIVLAAHGEMAPALVRAAEAIVGGLDHVQAVTLEAGADPEAMRARIIDAIRAVNSGDGVLVLCDMFGGTPSNVCLSCEVGVPVEVVTGVNLPMVLKASTSREMALPDAAGMIVAYGQRHIANATQLLRERRSAADRAREGDATAATR